MLHELAAGPCYHTLMEGLPLMSSFSVLSVDGMSMGKVTRILRSLRDSPDFIPNLQLLDIRIGTPNQPGSEDGRDMNFFKVEE
jgi:hypothetical protein